MTITIKHGFNSPIADDPNAATTQEVQPSHWNADHQITLPAKSIAANSTNAAAAATGIAATAANQVMRANTTNTGIGWGPINIDSGNAVTGTLPIANGGTGRANFTQDTIPYTGASGTQLTWSSNFRYEAAASTSGNLCVGTGSSFPNGNGCINALAGSQDTPLFFGEIADTARSSNLIEIYDVSQTIPVFSVDYTGRRLGLYSLESTQQQFITCGDGEWSFDMNIAAQGTLSAQLPFAGQKGLIITGQALHTEQLAEFIKGSTVVARIDANGKGSFGSTTNASNSTLHSGGSFAAGIRTRTFATTLDNNDYTLLCNATSAAFTATLPTAVGIAGRIYVIKKIDSSVNAVTVGTTSSQTIDGSTTRSLALQYSTLMVQSNGANWVRLSTI